MVLSGGSLRCGVGGSVVVSRAIAKMVLLVLTAVIVLVVIYPSVRGVAVSVVVSSAGSSLLLISFCWHG